MSRKAALVFFACAAVASVALAQTVASKTGSLRFKSFRDVSFSADGKKVLVVADDCDVHSVCASEVRIIDVDSGDATVVKVPAELRPQEPHFSPDGKQIVMQGSAKDLWLMDADGGNAVQITSKGSNSRPVFDATGTIVFRRQSEFNRDSIIGYDPKTKKERVIVPEADRIMWAIPGPNGIVVKHLAKFGGPWTVSVTGKKGLTALTGLPVKNPQDIEVFRSSGDANRRMVGVREENQDVPALWLRDEGKWVQIPDLRARYFDLSLDGKAFVFAGRPAEKAPEGVFFYAIDEKAGKPLTK